MRCAAGKRQVRLQARGAGYPGVRGGADSLKLVGPFCDGAGKAAIMVDGAGWGLGSRRRGWSNRWRCGSS
jgi:hypothetical protein